MHRRLRLALGSSLLAILAACSPSRDVPAPADLAAIAAAVDSVTDAFFVAVAARDTEAVVGFYVDDATLLPPNARMAAGRDSIRATWVGFLRLPALELTADPTSKVFSEAGDLVVDIGTYRMKMLGPKGKPVEDVGKYVAVYRRSAGQWKIVVDTFNSDLPASGSP